MAEGPPAGAPPQQEQQPYPPAEGQQPYPPAEGQQPYPPAEGQQPYPPAEGQEPYPQAEGQQQQQQQPYPPAEGQQQPYPPAEGQQQEPYPPAEGQQQQPYPPAEGQQQPYPGQPPPDAAQQQQPQQYPVEGQPMEGPHAYPGQENEPFFAEGQQPQQPYPQEQPPPAEGQYYAGAEGQQGQGQEYPGAALAGGDASSRTSELYRQRQGDWGSLSGVPLRRDPSQGQSPPDKESFIESYRSVRAQDSSSFTRYARYGADVCSIDLTDKANVDARDFLRNAKCKDGTTLWNHIRDVLELLLLERPPAPASFLESFSQRVRDARLRPRRRYPRDRVRPEHESANAHRVLELAQAEPPSDAHWPGGGAAPGGDDDDDGGADKAKAGKGGGGDTGGEEEDEEAGGGKLKPARWQDLLAVNYMLDQAGVGIPEDEAMLVNLAMRQLCHDEDVRKVQFWGKIFGIESNYYIVEVELSDNGLNKRLQEVDEMMEEEAEDEEGDMKPQTSEGAGDERRTAPLDEEQTEEEERSKAGHWGFPMPSTWSKPPPAFPPLPRVVIKPTVPVPVEPPGVGVNKKVYYVTNDPSEGWRPLPDVTPAQIQAARQIRRYFTGHLHAPVRSCPAFPGAERNLLRAQIARISAATHVSPMGFYTTPEEMGEGLEEEEEDEGEGGAGGARKAAGLPENPRYTAPALADLLESAAWVHHEEHILRQGRTKWWNPASPAPHEGEGEEEEEEKEDVEEEELPLDPNAPEPEVGPGLLTPLSEDTSLEASPMWTFRVGCSLLATLWGVALARSNLWPGAWAAAQGSLVVCFYVGWGVKAVAHSFTPTLPGPPQREYPIGPEVMEQTDPTPQEEEEWRKAHAPPTHLPFGEEGLFEDEEDELGSDDADDAD